MPQVPYNSGIGVFMLLNYVVLGIDRIYRLTDYALRHRTKVEKSKFMAKTITIICVFIGVFCIYLKINCVENSNMKS